MGAVNYSTSDYITLAVKLYDLDPLELEDAYTADRENVGYILSRYNLYYFHIAVKPGYYEGFSLDIEYNFPVAFDNWEEKREAQKEVTQIKRLLMECAGVGLVQCTPGWCTSYSDYTGTCKAISASVAEMRNDIKTTPTWAQYERETA